MQLTLITEQINAEVACIQDLRKRIAKLHNRGLYEQAVRYFRDIRNSERRIAELTQQKERILAERSRFYTVIQSLQSRGILAHPVKHVREVSEVN